MTNKVTSQLRRLLCFLIPHSPAELPANGEPLTRQCPHCGARFTLDYFESRDRGYSVWVKRAAA